MKEFLQQRGTQMSDRISTIFQKITIKLGRYIPWIHLTAAGALHLTANILAYFGPICTYDIFLTLGLLLAVVLSAGRYH